MRRSVLFMSAVVVAVALVSGASGSVGSVQARWVIRDFGTPAGRPSAATGLNAAGQVVGAYGAGPSWMHDCFVGFLWQRGRSKLIPADGCAGDMWRTNVARAITRGGRVLGEVFCAGCNGGIATFWLLPPLPNATNSQQTAGWQFSQGPNPRKGQPAKTCSLAPDGRTVCRPFQGLPAATGPKVDEMGCAIQNWKGVAINDRGDVVAYLDECVNAGTGDVLGPTSYFLAGPDGWVTFGPRGTGTVLALNTAGAVVGAIPVSSGDSHAFLWDGKRIADLGTLGGTRSKGTALNDRSEVVGTSTTRSGARHGFLWRNGRMTDIGAVWPVAVNAHGEVLGVRNEGKRLHAFLWRGGRLHDLGYWRSPAPWARYWGLGTPPRYTLSLDDRGRVAGADEAGHAMVWEGGRSTRLPELPGGNRSAALAVNAATGIAGWSTNARGVPHAVLWTRRSG